jgi:hypothetical protein
MRQPKKWQKTSILSGAAVVASRGINLRFRFHPVPFPFMKTIARLLVAGAAAALLASCATTETNRDMFIQSDTNKDGQLSLDEVNKAGLPRLFSLFDVDGKGSVTLAEARKVDPGFDAKMFNERDLDHDGKVTRAENENLAQRPRGEIMVRSSKLEA